MRGREGQTGYRIIIAETWMKEIGKFVTKEDDENFDNHYHWSASRGNVKIDISEWADATLKKLTAFLDDKIRAGDRSAKMSRNVLQQWLDIKGNPSGTCITKFENLAEGLRNYIRTLGKNRWVFERIEDGNMIPWFVEAVEYHPPSAYCASHVQVSLKAINSGFPESRDSSERGKCVTLGVHDFNKKLTMGQTLETKGLRLETPERVASYEKELEKYGKYYEEDGLQINVTGKAFLQKGWRESEFRTVEKSGRPVKMVVDPHEKEFGASAVVCEFWDKSDEVLWNLPVHPILDCFDLEEHAYYRVHINNAETYIYDTKVDDKLILPKDVKDFIEVLIEHSKNAFVDIVSGKEGGTILLLEGPPGTGKTLTAEVYSEVMEHPLYKVQSSQLGTDPQTVETQLKEVLQRAERWSAILLIDEADVYIHERGDNIDQNAIVGVFLRVLEYYRGVLFMTTNRGTIVDDAIVSRLTARFRYENPSQNEQGMLWKILAKQNNIDISEDEIRKIVMNNDKLSGRDIKNLLKLAYVSEIRKGGKVTAESVLKVTKFRQMIKG